MKISPTTTSIYRWIWINQWSPPSEAKAYLEDIGKLGWLADKSRPDIALVVNKLQRRAAAPRSEDGDALKQLNRYVKGTMDLGILLGKIWRWDLPDTLMLRIMTAKTGRSLKLSSFTLWDAQ